MTALLAFVPLPHPCTVCGEMHTQTVNGEPYDLCPSCETKWLNDQGDTQ
jgi:Zn-finger nucleic acid-binding protein